MSSPMQQRPASQVQDLYGLPPPPAPSSLAPSSSSRPSEPRKTSNIMSLLNNDPPPAASKRVAEVASVPPGPSRTPPPQNMDRSALGPAPPPAQMRQDPEPQFSPYGRTSRGGGDGGGGGIPSHKSSYGGSPNQPPLLGVPRPAVDPVASERDPYYRSHPGFQAGHQNGSNSPPMSHRFSPAQQSQGLPGPGPGQSQFAPQSGYPAVSYGQPQPHVASPPPPPQQHQQQQYQQHQHLQNQQHAKQPQQPLQANRQYGGRRPASRSHDGPPARDSAWPQQQQQQQPSTPGGWPSQPPKPSQGPPQQSWAAAGPPPHPSSASKPSTPAPGWSSAPPPQHVGMRDERGGPVYQNAQQQHAMHSRYPAPGLRPESVPSPTPGYPRYAATSGPPAHDPRDLPRSYTPSYDGRGPAGYPAPDPREVQMREGRDVRRDAREMMAKGMHPREYDRERQDRYGR
ncbi:hypothetical protein E4U52_005982 [Claviceps spartinae]|nr:hypothetical protein E4U52_005982 [Claviceps spartinae]